MLAYKNNRAQARDILEHIVNCNFTPPLSSYLDVDAYVEKMLKHAVRFECWDNKKLVGFLAAYCNDPNNEKSFITLVSVDKEYEGQGIAKALMNNLERYCRLKRFRTISLEVFADNFPALNLYEKRGFISVDQAGRAVTMTKDLSL